MLLPQDRDKLQSPKYVLIKLNVLNKNKMMDDVQKLNNCKVDVVMVGLTRVYNCGCLVS
jgi:hypothetical protein